MKKIFSLLISTLLILSVMPIVSPAGVGTGVDGGIGVSSVGPYVFQCGDRVVTDDEIQPWRVSGDGDNLIERNQHYLFEGERYEVDVLIFDKNKVEAAVVDIAMEGSCTESGPIVETVEYCESIPLTTADWSTTLTLDRFNPSLGTLMGAVVDVDTEMVSDIGFENEAANPATITVNVGGDITATLPDASNILSEIDLSVGDDVLAYDSVTDHAGDSGRMFNDESGTDSETQAIASGNFGFYTGIGTFDVDVSTASSSSASGSGTIDTSIQTQASAEACIIYTYQRTGIICEGSDVLNNCQEVPLNNITYDDCNARFGEEDLVKNPDTMRAYRCSLDVLDSEHMYGPSIMKVIAENPFTDGEGEYAESALWFMNPVISLDVSVLGDQDGLDFEDAMPGTSSYGTILIRNEAEGGVLMDMFIAGKDWPSADTDPLGRCWDGTQFVNYLPLESFSYYAENGAHSTRDETATGVCNNAITDSGYSSVCRNVDDEGYVNINKQIDSGFSEAMFNDAEIIQANPIVDLNGDGAATTNDIAWAANWLYPGSVGMSITFRLNLPEPCYGEYESADEGSIFIWGEAI
ncbi:choice-of-anchor E domain-containing protein [archaeon]|jgi:hypothetical protein|nr:choice-of-anchor E domain-containing protein [archaeon]